MGVGVKGRVCPLEVASAGELRFLTLGCNESRGYGLQAKAIGMAAPWIRLPPELGRSLNQRRMTLASLFGRPRPARNQSASLPLICKRSNRPGSEAAPAVTHPDCSAFGVFLF